MPWYMWVFVVISAVLFIATIGLFLFWSAWNIIRSIALASWGAKTAVTFDSQRWMSGGPEGGGGWILSGPLILPGRSDPVKVERVG